VIAALLILVPIVCVITWAFFRFAPRHVERKAVVRFNLGALALGLALAGAWCVRTYLVMSPTVDAAWWPLISLLGSLAIFPLALGVAAVLRSVVVFRSHARGSSR
jgi:hypothetical protein